MNKSVLYQNNYGVIYLFYKELGFFLGNIVYNIYIIQIRGVIVVYV